jgi:ATP-binding cassette subfamily B protein
MSEISLCELRNFVQIIPQENFFSREHWQIIYESPKEMQQNNRCREALYLASASELLQRLDDGLETVIGDKGVTLSGGKNSELRWHVLF